jgi:hypothetical protein
MSCVCSSVFVLYLTGCKELSLYAHVLRLLPPHSLDLHSCNASPHRDISNRKQCMLHLRHIRLEMLLYSFLLMVSSAQLFHLHLKYIAVTLRVLEGSYAD